MKCAKSQARETLDFTLTFRRDTSASTLYLSFISTSDMSSTLGKVLVAVSCVALLHGELTPSKSRGSLADNTAAFSTYERKSLPIPLVRYIMLMGKTCQH